MINKFTFSIIHIRHSKQGFREDDITKRLGTTGLKHEQFIIEDFGLAFETK